MEWLKIFSHSVGCHFVWLTIPFPYRSFSVSWVTFLVDLSACAIGVLFRNLSSVAMDSRLFLLLLSGSVLSGFMLRFLLHFVLSFVQGDRYGSIWILHADIQLDHHHLLKMVFFFFYFPFYISGVYQIRLVCFCQYQVVFITTALYVALEIWDGATSVSFFFPPIV